VVAAARARTLNADIVRFAEDAFDVLLSHAVTMRWVTVFREGRSRRSLHFWTVVCFLSRISRRIFMDQDRAQVYLATACFQPRFFNVLNGRAVYHCARQPRRGLWNTSMDLPSSYSVNRFSNHELTD
jgi:hypothetical protein